jgi:Secretion system C-terminal sorting domain
MKKNVLLFGILFLSSTLCFAQRVLLDFEPGGKTGQFIWFGADTWVDEPQFQIIANPDASGINASDSVALYIEPNAGEPWQGMFYKPLDAGDELIDFTGEYTELCIDVWMQAAGSVTLKAENNTNNIVFESPAQDVSTTGEWVEVCYDFAGSAVDGQMIETFVIFFNIGSVPAAVTEHYFDNLVQTGVPASVGYIDNSTFKVYPNPTNAMLNVQADFPIDQVIISDMVGKEWIRSNAPQEEISVESLPLGVYIVSITNEKGSKGSTKFVKK